MANVVSVCVAIKNRSIVHVAGRELRLFPNFVASLVAGLPADTACELVVADWNSDDWPLREWLEAAAAPLPVRVIQLDGGFSRGRGLNAAAAVAKGDVLFFADADVLISATLIEQGVASVARGEAFFPIVFEFADVDHTKGEWCYPGYGICMVDRLTFETAGRWPEYKKWGKEDDDFVAAVRSLRPIRRHEVPSFYHQWHPQDILWKDRFAERDPAEIDEIKQVREAIAEIARVVPAGESLILVDDARFGVDRIEDRTVTPFLEENGEYAGPPPDDETAIAALERLRGEGKNYLAIAWMAMWWLDTYPVFRDHVLSRFPEILNNERARVFDLRGSTHELSVR